MIPVGPCFRGAVVAVVVVLPSVDGVPLETFYLLCHVHGSCRLCFFSSRIQNLRREAGGETKFNDRDGT